MTTPRDPNASRNPDQLIRAFLDEGPMDLREQVYDEVRSEVDLTEQRTTFGPWRNLMATRFVGFAAVTAVAAAAVIVGLSLSGGGPFIGGAPTTSPSVQPSAEPSVAPSEAPSGDGSLPLGPHVMVSTDGLNEERVAVTIPAPGWFAEPDEASVTKDDVEDYPVTVVTVPGDHYSVPRDMCDWQTGDRDQDRIAGTVDELVAYLSEQTYDTPGYATGPLTRELSTPVDITIDGTPGKSVTGGLPSDPLACDEERFCSLLDRDGAQCLLLHERNQVVTLWISHPDDRNPPLWVVAGSHTWTAGSEVVAEMNAIVDSMTILHE
jgi:hypothetical protein